MPQGYSEWGSENKKTGDGQKTIKPGKSDEDIDKPQRKQLLLVHGIPQIQGDLWLQPPGRPWGRYVWI